jgi:hypothetical protein
MQARELVLVVLVTGHVLETLERPSQESRRMTPAIYGGRRRTRV